MTKIQVLKINGNSWHYVFNLDLAYTHWAIFQKIKCEHGFKKS